MLHYVRMAAVRRAGKWRVVGRVVTAVVLTVTIVGVAAPAAHAAPTFQRHIDFGPRRGLVANGYRRDWGDGTNADHGWTEYYYYEGYTCCGKRRHKVADLRYDTTLAVHSYAYDDGHGTTEWKQHLPTDSGTYKVTVGVGDANLWGDTTVWLEACSAPDVCRIAIPLIVDFRGTAAQPFATATATITTHFEDIYLDPHPGRGHISNGRWDFVDIVKIG
jgi:hypothetical protein